MVRRIITVCLLVVIAVATTVAARSQSRRLAPTEPIHPVVVGTVSVWPDTAVRSELHVMAKIHQRAVKAAAERRQRAAQARANRSERRRALVGSCTSSNWRSTMTADEIWIDERESGLNPYAENPSGAFGLGQLKAYPHTYDPCLQLRYQREYIAGRYGSEDNAVAFWQGHGWY